MSNLPTISINEIQQMAGAVVASQLFGGIKTKEQAFTLMLLCQAKGLHPIEAMERYHLIQGRPALKAETIIAEFQKAGGVVNWDEYSDERVTGTFSHPQGGSLTNTWDMARAQKAGLAGKDNWKNYSAAMLASRCATEAIRRVYPGCLQGMHSVEEVQEIVDAEFVPTQRKAAKKPEAVEAAPVVVEAEPLDRSAQAEYIKELGAMLRALINPETIANEIKTRHELKNKLTEVTDLVLQYKILADLSDALDAQREEQEKAA
jgi:hypothetical protein